MIEANVRRIFEGYRDCIVALLPGAETYLSGSASIPGIGASDVDLVVIVDDVRGAAEQLRRVYPPLYEEQWSEDWAAFRVPGPPQVDLVVTGEGTKWDAQHRLAWQLLAADAKLLSEYTALKGTPEGYPERKAAFFERVARQLGTGSEPSDDVTVDRREGADLPALEAALFEAFGRRPQEVARTASGTSTAVYRVVVDSRTYYARLAEEEGDNLSVDARILTELCAAGVRAPQVVHLSPCQPHLRRSLLITTEVAGMPLAMMRAADASQVAREAGRDLAMVHRLPIDGFGFVRRDRATWPATGEFASYETFIRAELPDSWPGPFASIFKPGSLPSLLAVIENEQHRSLPHATFAHGDFDLTHIFALEDRYTGLIDFGEVRGAEPAFDFGVLLFANVGTDREALLDSVIAGYQTLTPLEGEREEIIRSAIVHGLRLLGRWTKPDFTRRRPVQDFARRVEALLDRL